MNQDVKMNDVLDVYRMYIGIKLHFTQENYIYSSSFRRKTVNAHSMDQRNDVDLFIRVTELYYQKFDELKEVLISLFKHNPDAYIHDVIKRREVDDIHLKRMGFMANLDYTLNKDKQRLLDFLKLNDYTIHDVIQVVKNDRPIIIRKLRLSDEFLSLLDFYYPYLDQETINPLWCKRMFILSKYKHLIVNNTVDEIFKELI